MYAIPQSSIAATALPWTLRTDAHKQDGGHGAQRATLMGSMGGDGEDLPRHDVEEADEDLRAVLPDVDRFWIRWSAMADELKGVG